MASKNGTLRLKLHPAKKTRDVLSRGMKRSYSCEEEHIRLAKENRDLYIPKFIRRIGGGGRSDRLRELWNPGVGLRIAVFRIWPKTFSGFKLPPRSDPHYIYDLAESSDDPLKVTDLCCSPESSKVHAALQNNIALFNARHTRPDSGNGDGVLDQHNLAAVNGTGHDNQTAVVDAGSNDTHDGLNIADETADRRAVFSGAYDGSYNGSDTTEYGDSDADEEYVPNKVSSQHSDVEDRSSNLSEPTADHSHASIEHKKLLGQRHMVTRNSETNVDRGLIYVPPIAVMQSEQARRYISDAPVGFGQGARVGSNEESSSGNTHEGPAENSHESQAGSGQEGSEHYNKNSPAASVDVQNSARLVQTTQEGHEHPDREGTTRSNRPTTGMSNQEDVPRAIPNGSAGSGQADDVHTANLDGPTSNTNREGADEPHRSGPENTIGTAQTITGIDSLAGWLSEFTTEEQKDLLHDLYAESKSDNQKEFICMTAEPLIFPEGLSPLAYALVARDIRASATGKKRSSLQAEDSIVERAKKRQNRISLREQSGSLSDRVVGAKDKDLMGA